MSLVQLRPEAPFCGHSSSGRAPPCQGGGSEFESRCPLQKSLQALKACKLIWRHSQVVRQRTANPRFPGSNPGDASILTKRYRCVWRKARRINRFRAFSGPDFFFQTIDANRCFRASAPIQTGCFLFSGRCVQPAPFLSGDFSGWQRYFSQKNSQRFGRRFVGPEGLRKRCPFSFQKGRW